MTEESDARLAALEAQITLLTGAEIKVASVNGIYDAYTMASVHVGNTGSVVSELATEVAQISFDGNGNCSITDSDITNFSVRTVLEVEPDPPFNDNWVLINTGEEQSESDPSDCIYSVSQSGLLTLQYLDVLGNLSGDGDTIQMTPDLNFGAGNFAETENLGGGQSAYEVGMYNLVKRAGSGN